MNPLDDKGFIQSLVYVIVWFVESLIWKRKKKNETKKDESVRLKKTL